MVTKKQKTASITKIQDGLELIHFNQAAQAQTALAKPRLWTKKIIAFVTSFGFVISLGLGAAAVASVTISGSGITGDSAFNSVSTGASTVVDTGASTSTLSLQTSNNGPVNFGTGTFTNNGPSIFNSTTTFTSNKIVFNNATNSLLYATSSGQLSPLTIGSGLQISNSTLSSTAGGGGEILASSYGFLLNGSDESGLFQTFLTNCASNAVGAYPTLVIDPFKTLTIKNPVNTPCTANPGNNRGSCRIRGSVRSGVYTYVGNCAGGCLDLETTTGTTSSISLYHRGLFELSDLAVINNGSGTACDTFIDDFNSIMNITDVLFWGGVNGVKAAGHNACNLALYLGGVTNSSGSVDYTGGTGGFSGYGTRIINTDFLSMRSALQANSSVNGIFWDNIYVNGGSTSSPTSIVTLNGCGCGGSSASEKVRLSYFGHTLAEMGDGQGGDYQNAAIVFSLAEGNVIDGWQIWDGPVSAVAFSRANGLNPVSNGNIFMPTNKTDGSTPLFDATWNDTLNSLPTVNATSSLTFGAIGNASCSADQTITTTTANNFLVSQVRAVQPMVPSNFPAGLVEFPFASANNQVSIRICNFSGSTSTPGTITVGAIINRGL